MAAGSAVAAGAGAGVGGVDVDVPAAGTASVAGFAASEAGGVAWARARPETRSTNERAVSPRAKRMPIM